MATLSEYHSALADLKSSGERLQEAWEVENFFSFLFNQVTAVRRSQAQEFDAKKSELEKIISDLKDGGINPQKKESI